MTGGGHNTQEELASYAMQNLSPEDSASIKEHLQGCAPCRAELAEVYGDLALMGIAVEQHPLPEGARERFLKRIADFPAVKPQETVKEVPPISVKSTRRGPAFWTPWIAAAAMTIAAISLGKAGGGIMRCTMAATAGGGTSVASGTTTRRRWTVRRVMFQRITPTTSPMEMHPRLPMPRRPARTSRHHRRRIPAQARSAAPLSVACWAGS